MGRLPIYPLVAKLVPLFFAVYGVPDLNNIDSRKDACGTHAVCNCYMEKTLSIVDCAGRNLTTLPGGIKSSVNAIILAKNRIHDLKADSFTGKSELVYLDISNNRLEELPRDLFLTTTRIITLDLANNFLRQIRSSHFANLRGLNYLDLRNNKLKTLPEGLFAYANHMETVHLEGNDLIALPKTLFGQSSKLKKLYLSGNKLLTVPETTIQNLPFLSILDISRNHIEEIAEGTFANLTSLMALLLTANKIRKLPKDLLVSQGILETVDISNNAITNVAANIFPTVHCLDDINLSINNLTILPHNFIGPVKKIKTIQLSQNNIEFLTKEIFRSLKEVLYFYLSQNQLSYLPEDLFSEIQISNTLDLSNNRLAKLPIGLFDSNNKTHGLQTLLLQRNFLTHLPAKIFKGLKSLKTICLFYNNIQHLGDRVFAGIGIEKIYLFGNNLSTFAGKAFHNKDIQEIHLYGNSITHLSGTALAGLDVATKVFIDCEQIEDVLRTNLYIICVTPDYVPILRVNSNLRSSFEHEGFKCSSAMPICDCSPCPRGTYGDGRQFCLRCPSGGFYQDDIGTVSHENGDVCKRCRNGTYVKEGGAISTADCKVCPDGTKKDVHAGYRACHCIDNHARLDRFGPCFVCKDKGVTCSQDYKSISSGFYWNWDFQNANLSKYVMFVNNLKTENGSFDENTAYNEQIPRAHRCPRRGSCNNTPGDVQATCSKGYRGWLCNKCDVNYYSVMNYCLPCPDAIIFLFVDVLLVIGFCTLVYVVILFRYKTTKSREQSRSIVEVVISRSKILLGFYQVVGSFFSSLHNVNWTGALYYFGEFISYIELNIFRIFIRPQCFHEKLVMNPKIEFIAGMAFICCVLILSMLLYQTMKIRHIVKKRGNVDACALNRYSKPLKSKIVTCVIILLFVTYPPICTIIFQLYPLACQTFCFDVTNQECIRVLREDYDLDCKDVMVFNVLAFAATIAYVLAFPTTLFLWLRAIFRSSSSPTLDTSRADSREEKGSKMIQVTDEMNQDEKKVPIWVDFLCENYKPQYWYWEIVELARKVKQTFIVTLLGWEDKLTVLATIGISVLFLTLHARYMPMKNSFDQYLQMFSLTAILINVVVAAVDTPEEYEGSMSYALVVLNAAVLIIIAGETVVRVFLRLRRLGFLCRCIVVKLRVFYTMLSMKNTERLIKS